MKNLTRAGLALFVLVFPTIVWGQAASWIKSYGADTDGRENAESAVFAPDGGSYLGSACWAVNAGYPDVGVARLDSNGHVLWRQAIGADAWDYDPHMVADADGAWVVAQTNSFGSDDAWVLRFDTAGTLLKQFTVGGDGSDAAVSVVPAANGAVTLAGSSSSFGNGSIGEAWLARVTAAGTIAWSYRYGSGQSNFALESAAAAVGGGLYVAGEVRDDPEDGQDDWWVAHLDDAGAIVWQRRLGTPIHDLVTQDRGVAGMADGGVIVCGNLNVTAETRETAAIRFDATGAVVWERRFALPGTLGQSECQGVRALPEGGSLLALRTSLHDGTVLVELDAAGGVVGRRAWEGVTPQSLDLLPSGEALLTLGYTQDRDAPSAYPGSAPWVARLLPGGSPAACGAAYDQAVVTDDPQLVATTAGAARHNLTVAATPTGEIPYARSFPEMVECPCTLPSWNGALHVVGSLFTTTVNLEWTPVVDSRVDVVRGDLGVLRATGGNFAAALSAITSTDACVGNNQTQGSLPDTIGAPAIGSGHFYLARGETAACPREGSYNDGTQAASRDAGVISPPTTCP